MRKSKLRVKNELCKQQYTCTVALFDFIHLAQVKVLCQMPEIMCCFTVFALLYFGQFPSTSPWGLCLEGQFIWECFCIASLGSLSYMYFEVLIYGGAYFWNFVVTELWQQLTPIIRNTLYWSNEEWFSQLWVQFMQLCKIPEKSSRLQWDLNPWPCDIGAML